MPDTPTDPIGAIPSSVGIIANAGKEPLPVLLDLNRDGVLDANQKWFWNGIGSTLYWLLGRFFPTALESQVVKAAIPKIRTLIDEVTQ